MSDCVYFAERDGLIKIGWSCSPRERARRQRARLVAFIPGGCATEREHHKRFAGSRVKGEWFRPTLDLLAYISTLPLPPRPQARWLTAVAAGRMFGVHGSTVTAWAKAGLVPSWVLPSGTRRYDVDVVRQLATSRAAS